MTQSLSIGRLTKATGTKPETIRWYERIGLLPSPARTAGNYRSYSTAHLERLSFIRRARGLGFTLEQVRDLLRLADQRDHPCGEVDAIARVHLAEVERKIADLEALRNRLADVVGQCSNDGTIAACRIVGALSPLLVENL